MIRSSTLLFFFSLLFLALDQGSKYYVVEVLDLRNIGRLDVLPPVLNFRMGWNDGINFGILSSGAHIWRWALIVIAVGISIWISIWTVRIGRTSALLCGGLIIGGALGNVFDRVIRGAVADFLNMSCCGIINPFVFNIADVFIFMGLIGLIFLEGRQEVTDGSN